MGVLGRGGSPDRLAHNGLRLCPNAGLAPRALDQGLRQAPARVHAAIRIPGAIGSAEGDRPRLVVGPTGGALGLGSAQRNVGVHAWRHRITERKSAWEPFLEAREQAGRVTAASPSSALGEDWSRTGTS